MSAYVIDAVRRLATLAWCVSNVSPGYGQLQWFKQDAEIWIGELNQD